MLPLLLLAGLVASAPPSPGPASPDASAYEAARAKAGRDSDAHVKLALWCEALGMPAERAKHLATAVLLDPKNAMARSLLGMVAFAGRWQRPDAVADAVNSDRGRQAKTNEYVAKRAKTPSTAEAQWKLALWCEENGLKEAAIAHLTATVRLDPSREAAWKRLGYKRQGSRWATDAQLAAEREEAEAQKRADRYWKPRLSRWREALGEKSRRAEAERSLQGITDPRAVASVWSIFGTGGPGAQARAVEILGQIDGPAASRALASLAVFGRSAEVRRTAVETLRRRDAREYLGLIVGLVQSPLKASARPVGGPAEPGELFVEGERYNVRRLYGPDPRFINRMVLPPRFFDASVPFDPYSPTNLWLALGAPGSPSAGAQQLLSKLPGHPQGSQPSSAPTSTPGTGVLNLTALAAQRDLQIANTLRTLQFAETLSQQQLANDLAQIEGINEGIHELNRRTLPALSALTGQDLGEDGDAWRAWWTDQRGYRYEATSSASKPTFTEWVPSPNLPPQHSCFGAGTLVRTLDGLRAIESIQTGDQVLTQDARTGCLSYQPVVAAYHNKPTPTLRVELDGETVVATPIHRFWKTGRGWVMARELTAGDSLRTIGGLSRVLSVTSAPTQPVYNLEVATGASFFVGRMGALVHDNSIVQPVSDPFDAPPRLADGSAAGP